MHTLYTRTCTHAFSTLDPRFVTTFLLGYRHFGNTMKLLSLLLIRYPYLLAYLTKAWERMKSVHVYSSEIQYGIYIPTYIHMGTLTKFYMYSGIP